MQILFNGLCNGALIALLAMAFVIVYLPTKVFYIALAGVYVLGAYLTKQLMAWGLPCPLAVLGALAAGVGVFFDWLKCSDLGLRFRGLPYNTVEMGLVRYNPDRPRTLAFTSCGFLGSAAGIINATTPTRGVKNSTTNAISLILSSV